MLAKFPSAQLRFTFRVLTSVKGLSNERCMLSGVLVVHVIRGALKFGYCAVDLLQNNYDISETEEKTT